MTETYRFQEIFRKIKTLNVAVGQRSVRKLTISVVSRRKSDEKYAIGAVNSIKMCCM